MVAPSPFLTEASNGQVGSSPFAESDHSSAGTWMGRNKCFVLESFAAVDEGAGSDRIEDMQRRWSKAVDVFLFLIHYKKETHSSDNDGGDCSDDGDAVSQFKATWYDKLKNLHTDPQTRHYHTMVHLAEMFGFLDMLLPNSPVGLADGILSAEVLARQRAAPIRAMLEAVSTMATFFHDAVYDATSSTNEEDSAELFRDFAGDLKALADGGDDETTPRACTLFDFAVDWVGRYILSTKSHSATINGENADDVDVFGNSRGMLNHLTRYFSRHMLAFLDADMAVLAKESEAYDAYAGLIRKEYIHVPRDVYCQKRAEVLESFLVDPMTGKTKFIFATDAMRTSYELKAKDNLQKEIDALKSGVIPCEDIVEDGEIENKAGSGGVLEEEVNGNDSDIAKERKDNDAHAGSFDESDKEENATVKDAPDGGDDNNLAPGWDAVHDPNSGREYYYNSQTGDTVWDKPVIPQEELTEFNTGHSNALAADDLVEVEEPSEEIVAIESNAEVPVADTIVDSDSPSKQADVDVDVVADETIAEDEVERNVLPNGWQELTDDSGNLYYYNAGTGETSWTRPTSDFSSAAAGANTSHDFKNSVKEEKNEEEVVNEQTPLPDGWTSLTDESSGRIYFYNEGTGETSWDRPVDNVADDSNVDDVTKDAILVNTGVASESDPGIAAADLFAQPHLANDAFAEPASDVDVPTTTEGNPFDTANDGIIDTSPSEDVDDKIVETISNDKVAEDAVNPFMEEPTADSFASSAFDQPAPAESTESSAGESNAADIFAAPSPTNKSVSSEAAALSSSSDLGHNGSVEGKKETLEDTSTDAPPLSAGWTELIDESSGRVYYYNEKSGITSWDRPSVPSSGPPDTAEEASSNNLPIDDGVESESESLEDIPTADAADYFPEEDKEDIAQNTSSEATGGLNTQPLDQVQEQPLPEGWEQLVDPSSGNPYYYYKIDGTTSWDRPVM